MLEARVPPIDMSSREGRLAFYDDLSEWGVLVFVLVLPFFHMAPWRYVGRYALVVAAAAWGLSFASRRTLRLPRGPILWWTLAFVGVSFVSAVLAVDPGTSLHAFLRFGLRSFLLFLIVSASFSQEARMRRLMAALGFSGVLLVLSGLRLVFQGSLNPWGGLMGPDMESNAVCMWLVPAFSALMAITLGARQEAAAALWGAAAVAVIVSIFLTFSKIGWLAFACLLGIWWLLSPKRRVVVSLAGVGLATFFVLMPDLSGLLWTTDNALYLALENQPLDYRVMKWISLREILTMNDRLDFAWKPALALLRERPLLGSGYGPDTFLSLTARSRPILTHEHNAFLAVAVQSGLAGAAAWMGLLVTAAAAMARVSRRGGQSFQRLASLAVLGALASEYVVQGLGEPVNNGRMGLLFFILAGMAAALSDPERRES